MPIRGGEIRDRLLQLVDFFRQAGFRSLVYEPGNLAQGVRESFFQIEFRLEGFALGQEVLALLSAGGLDLFAEGVDLRLNLFGAVGSTGCSSGDFLLF